MKSTPRGPAVLTATLLAGVLSIGIPVPAVGDDVPVVVGSVGDVRYQLTESAGGHHLEVVVGEETWWADGGGAVGLRLDGAADYAYQPYDEVAVIGDEIVATTTLDAASSQIAVVDRLSVADGALRVARTFEVVGDQADAHRGFSLSFALRGAQGPDDYQWFAPGTWYGNSADGSFTTRNNMAFDGDLTSMAVDNLGAPLVAAYESDAGRALVVRDTTPGRGETVSADRQPQYANTIIDERINLAGLGVRSAEDGTEVFHSYPGWTHNYRDRYAGDPEINRYAPLTDGRTGTTALEVEVAAAGTFPEAVETIWRAAYDQYAKVIERYDTKIHFDTLVDYLDDSFGVVGGRPQYASHYDHRQPTSGFLYRNTDIGWVLLAQGWDRGDDGMLERARTVIDDQVTVGGLDSSNVRTTAEGHLSLLRAYLVELEHGVEHPAWLAKVAGWAAALPATPTYYAVAPLVLLAEVTGDAALRTRAVAAAEAAWSGGHDRLRFAGSLEDYAGGPPEHDREAGYLALEAYLSLATSATSEAERATWVERARWAATFAETWQRIDDLEMVPIDAESDLLMYGNDHVPPYGMSVIHAGSNAGDQYGALEAAEFALLADLTGDEHFQDFARYLEKNSMLYTNLGDKAGWMADAHRGSGLGFTNEYLGSGANDYWDNNRRGDGHNSNLAWTSFVLAAMTQRTLDLFGSYSVTGPAVSDLVGLDAYYRVVNRATGEVLGTVDSSREHGAEIVATATDAADRTQQWLVQWLDDGEVKLVNRLSGKVLQLGGPAAVGTGLVQGVLDPSDPYRMELTAGTDGALVLSPADADLVLEAGYGTGAVRLATATGSDFQRWRLEPVGDVRLAGATTTDVLTVAGDGVSMTALADQATLAQRWSFVPLGTGWSAVVSRDTGEVLTATAAGLGVGTATPDGYSWAQQWGVAPAADGTATLVPRAGEVTTPLRLQTAGPATTSAPASVVAVPRVSVVLELGAVPALPATVAVALSDDTASESAVTWADLETPEAPGTYRVTGTVAGTAMVAIADVVVLPVGGVVAIDEVAVTTTVDTPPELPATVIGRDAADVGHVLPVVWEDVDPADLAEPGSFTVAGTVPGVTRPALARVTVEPPAQAEIEAVESVRVVTEPDVAPLLPAEVQVTIAGGGTGTLPVSWDDIDPADLAEPGYLQVTGAVTGTELPALAYVTVAHFYDDFSSGTVDRWTPGGAAQYTVTDGVATTPNTSHGSSQWLFAKGADGQPLAVTDAVVEARVQILQQNGGLWLRAPNATDSGGYYVGVERHRAYAVAGKNVSGSFSEWAYGPVGGDPASFRTLRAVLDGSSIAFYVDGSTTPFHARTDTSFASGQLGVRSWTGGMSIDHYLVAPLPEILSLEEVMLTTTVGVAPDLPATIVGLLEDGTRADQPVTWDVVDPEAWQEPGIVEVAGTSGGLPVAARVTVTGPAVITGVRGVLVLVAPGEEPELPDQVTVVLEDGGTDTASVVWEDSADLPGTTPGYVRVAGEVAGTELPAWATVGITSYGADLTEVCPPAAWTTYAGSWVCDGRGWGPVSGSTQGEKAVAPASGTDLVVEGDVMVVGSGQAGLILRVSAPAVGADAYRGYYVGINTANAGVVLGRANNSWSELASVTGVPGVAANLSVTIRVVAQGRTLDVYVGDMTDPVLSYTDTSGAAHTGGQVGVRGYNTTYRVADLAVATAPPALAVEPATATTVAGVVPSLPSTVTVTDWSGRSTQLPVTWDLAGVEFFEGEVVVSGTTSGGDAAAAVVTVLPAVLTGVEPIAVATVVGVAPDLPDEVTARYSDGSTTLVPVTWQAVAPERYAQAGGFEVRGQVEWSGGTAVAVAWVTVAPAPDTTPPVVAAEFDEVARTVTVTATDEDSGVDSVEYRLGTEGAWLVYTEPVAVGEEAVVFQYRATDVAGNVSEVGELDIPAVEEPVDVTPPVVAAEFDEVARTVTVTATDEGSGVDVVEYRLGTEGAWLLYTVPVAVGDEAVVFQFRATDVAGNTSEVGSIEIPAVEVPFEFTDVPVSHPFYAEIQWMAQSGLSTGYEDGSFGPNGVVSRQAMAAFLYRYVGADYVPGAGVQTFTDVPSSHPFYVEIEWLAEAGIAAGYEDGTFGPGRAVSRQAMAAYLHRLAGEPAASTSPEFTDVPVSHPFYAAIAWLAESEITAGYEDGSFGAGLSISRQAMSAFLFRFDQLGLDLG